MDKDAYIALYNRYREPLYLYACRLVKDDDLAADLVQDVMVRLWERRDQALPAAAMEGYLFSALRYRFFDWIDRQKVRTDYASSFQQFLDQGEWQTDNAIAEQEMMRFVEQQINQLPDRMRMVFLMNYRDRLSYSEIAEKLGISEKTVHNQVNNAQNILRKKLGSYSWLLLLLF